MPQTWRAPGNRVAVCRPEMKLLSFVLFFVSTVSLALPLDSEEADVSQQPVLTNETGDFNEASESPGEVFEDTSLEFLDDQPESRENLVPSDEFVAYEGYLSIICSHFSFLVIYTVYRHAINKRSTETVKSIWSSLYEYGQLFVSLLWLLADKAVIEPWLNISSLLSRLFRSLNANLSVGGNIPGEPMIRYNLNGDFNMTNILSWDYWTTVIQKLVQDS